MKAFAKTAALLAAWCALAWVLLLQGLGGFGLIGPDEPRYAAVAAAMLCGRDFVTPRLWGAPWFEKPVLFYWLAAASDALTRVGAAASRRPNAILALLLSAALWRFLRRVHSPRAGALAGFFSLTTVFVFGFGRAATTDMTLTAPLALCFMALYLWWRENSSTWLAAAAAALGFATLAKGPVAIVLVALALLAFAATQGRWTRAFSTLSARPVCLFLLIAAPWYVASQWRNPDFAGVFFLQQNLERFATNRYQHPQPFWFYLPVLLLALFPWTGWLGLPLAALVRRFRRLGWGGFWLGRDAPLKFFLGCWLVIPLAFFSFSASKLPSYILPAVPAAAALIAVCAADTWDRLPRWPLLISALLAGLIPPAVRLAPWLLTPRLLRPPLLPLLGDPTVWGWGVGAAVVLCTLAWRRRAAALIAATSILVAATVLLLTHAPLSHSVNLAYSGQPLAQQLQRSCTADPDTLPATCNRVPLYAWRLNRDVLYSAEFYLNGELTAFPPPGPLPANAVVVVARQDEPAFVVQYGAQYGAGRQIAFLSGWPASPWLALRVTSTQPRAPH